MTVYDTVGGSTGTSNVWNDRNEVHYTVPSGRQREQVYEYELPQIIDNTLSSKKHAQAGEQCVFQSAGVQDKLVKDGGNLKKKWFITLAILVTVFAVFTLIALAIGALSLNTVQQNEGSKSQFATGPCAISEESLNCTNLLSEIRTLNTLFNQLNSDTRRNFSQLLNLVRLLDGSDSALQFSNQLMMIQNDISSVNLRQNGLRSDISAALTNIVSVSRQLSTARGDITSVNSRVSRDISSLLSTNIIPVSSSMRQHINTAQQSSSAISGTLSSQVRSVSTLNT